MLHCLLVVVGQCCTAGSRIFVQESIYDTVQAKFIEYASGLTNKTGDPFKLDTQHGPQVSQTQFDVSIKRGDCYHSLVSNLAIYPVSSVS